MFNSLFNGDFLSLNLLKSILPSKSVELIFKIEKEMVPSHNKKLIGKKYLNLILKKNIISLHAYSWFLNIIFVYNSISYFILFV